MISDKPFNLSTNSMCGINGLDPQIITGYLVVLLRSIFSDERNMTSSPEFRARPFTWEPADPVNQVINTKIIIDSVGNFNAKLANAVPGIYIQRVATQAGKLLISDMTHTPVDKLGSVNAEEVPTLGHRQQIVPIQCSHTLYVVNSTPGGAERMGIEVFHYLSDFQSIIRRDLQLKSISIGDFSAIQKIEHFGGNYVAPIVVNCTYHRVTILREESPILRAIDQQLTGGNNT